MVSIPALNPIVCEERKKNLELFNHTSAVSLVNPLLTMCVHSAWNLLFYNPHFWSSVGKHGFLLREVCKTFRAEVPDHVAIAAVFKSRRCRKVVLFRLLPLSVNDVVGMRSPAMFLDAFAIAIRKVGGFADCMALLRDRGWRSWCEVGLKRRAARDRVDGLIRDSGFVGRVEDENPVYMSAITTRRRVDRAVVWTYECTYEGLLPWEQHNPWLTPDGVRRARVLHNMVELKGLVRMLHDVVGFWYKGIHGDVFKIETSIRMVRDSGGPLPGNVLQHQMISGGVLILGEVKFKVWVPPPNRMIGV